MDRSMTQDPDYLLEQERDREIEERQTYGGMTVDEAVDEAWIRKRVAALEVTTRQADATAAFVERSEKPEPLGPRIYLTPGAQVQTVCELTLGEDGEWHFEEMVASDELRHWREDPKHPDGGEWFHVHYDCSFGPGPKPASRYYYDGSDPGY